MGIGITSTNRVKHSKVRESTFGTTPTNPVFKEMRVTGSGLNINPMTVISDEIRSDRQIADLILVGQQAGGDVNSELSFKMFDDDFEEVLQGAWSSKPNKENTASNTPISALSATTITVASGGTAFLTNHLVVLRGFPTAANNDTAKVVTTSTGTTIVFAAATWTAETAAIPVGAFARVVGYAGASADIAATATGLSSTTLNFTTLGLAVGEWIKIGGSAAGTKFATAALNDWCRISAIAANALTFDIRPSGWTTDAGTGKTIYLFFGDILSNASTQYSNTIERQYLDQASPGYELLVGMVLDSMSMNVTAQQIVTNTRTYLGSTGSVSTTRASGATDITAPTYPVLNASAHVGSIMVNGAVLPGQNYVMDATVEVKNNQRHLFAIGNMGAVGVGNGQFEVSGRLNTYFADSTLLDYLLNNTQVSFTFRVQDAATPKEAYFFDFPNVQFRSGSPTVPGKNQNVMLPLDYAAIRHATLNYTMLVQRHFYLE